MSLDARLLHSLSISLITLGFQAAAHAEFAVKTVALKGEQAPGFPVGTNYYVGGNPCVLDSKGRVAFSYNITGGPYVSWVTGPNGNAPVPFAMTNAPAPGSPGDFFWYQYPPSLGDGGYVSFGEELTTGGGAAGSNGSGFFVGDSSGLQLAARSGVKMDVLGGGTFDADDFATTYLMHGDKAVFFANAHINSGPNATAGLWMASQDGSLKTLALGQGTLNFVMFPEGIDDSGKVGFLSNNNLRMYVADPASGSVRPAAYTGGTYGAAYSASGDWSFLDPSQHHLLLLRSSGTLIEMATAGSAAPGMPAGTTFSSFNNAAIPSRSAKNFTFRAALTGPGFTDAQAGSEFAIVNGQVRYLARLNDQAPLMAEGVTLSSLPDAIVNDAGQILFNAHVRGPGITEMNDRVLWYEDAAGQVQVLLREGDPFTFDGQTRTILDFNAAVFSSSGSVGNDTLNEAGQFVCPIDFLDGSSGVFLFQIPEPGGPIGAIGLWTLRCFARRGRRPSKKMSLGPRGVDRFVVSPCQST